MKENAISAESQALNIPVLKRSFSSAADHGVANKPNHSTL